MKYVTCLFVTLFVTGAALSLAAWARLRGRHPEKWSELVEEPVRNGRGSVYMSLWRLRYIMLGEYRVLNDPFLVWMFAVLRCLLPLYIAVFVFLCFSAPGSVGL